MIKLGMIGGGINSAVGAAHVAALRMTGKFEFVAGCFSHDPDESVSSAIKYGVRSDSRIEDLLTRDTARIVVLSPTPLHFEHVSMCMSADIPTLCEKALGVSTKEIGQLICSTPLSVVYNYAFYPAVRKLRELLRDGEFGEVTHIHAEMPQSGYLVGKPQEWRLSDMGIYLDLGTHLHHLIWFLTGQLPNEVYATERNWAHDVGVVDYVSAQITYSTFQAHVWFSKVSAGYTNGLRIRVFGTKGSAEWHQRDPDVLRIANAEFSFAPVLMEVPNPRFKLGHPTGYVEALANLYEAWAEDPSHPDLSPAVAHEGLLLMEAMRESALSGKGVLL